MDVEDLDVYRKLCQLHIEVCDLTHQWLKEEKYELGGQARRSSIRLRSLQRRIRMNYVRLIGPFPLKPETCEHLPSAQLERTRASFPQPCFGGSIGAPDRSVAWHMLCIFSKQVG